MIGFNKKIMVIIKSITCLKYKKKSKKYAHIFSIEKFKKNYYKFLIIIFFNY